VSRQRRSPFQRDGSTACDYNALPECPTEKGIAGTKIVPLLLLFRRCRTPLARSRNDDFFSSLGDLFGELAHFSIPDFDDKAISEAVKKSGQVRRAEPKSSRCGNGNRQCTQRPDSVLSSTERPDDRAYEFGPSKQPDTQWHNLGREKRRDNQGHTESPTNVLNDRQRREA